MNRVILLAASLLLICVSASAQSEPRRVALLIGNSDYEHATRLTNPPNDVRLVANALRAAGFQSVNIAEDVHRQGFETALRDFARIADGAQVAAIYFAGHGIEGDGRNWLIPVDATLSAQRDLPFEAVDLDLALQTMSGATMRLVFLDACRNNPFGRNWTSDSRTVSRGLAPVDADEVMVVYAAAPGQTASDGEGGNSPFAAALAASLVRSDLPVQMLGGAVRDSVLEATRGNQRPFVTASVSGTPLYLRPQTHSTARPPAQSTAAYPTRPPMVSGGETLTVSWAELGDSVTATPRDRELVRTANRVAQQLSSEGERGLQFSDDPRSADIALLVADGRLFLAADAIEFWGGRRAPSIPAGELSVERLRSTLAVTQRALALRHAVRAVSQSSATHWLRVEVFVRSAEPVDGTTCAEHDPSELSAVPEDAVRIDGLTTTAIANCSILYFQYRNVGPVPLDVTPLYISATLETYFIGTYSNAPYEGMRLNPGQARVISFTEVISDQELEASGRYSVVALAVPASGRGPARDYRRLAGDAQSDVLSATAFLAEGGGAREVSLIQSR